MMKTSLSATKVLLAVAAVAVSIGGYGCSVEPEDGGARGAAESNLSGEDGDFDGGAAPDQETDFDGGAAPDQETDSDGGAAPDPWSDIFVP